MGKLIQLLKKNIENIETYRYHLISNRTALTILKNLEENGKLPSKIKKECDDYAVKILNWKGYAPWLYVYSYISGEFKKGWIPDNYYRNKIIPKTQGLYGKTSVLKPLTNKLFNEKICPDLLYYINNYWIDNNYNAVNKKNIEELLFKTNDKIICKLDSSFQGKGIYIYTKETFSIKKIEKLGNCVIQSFIEQHDFFNKITHKSVATIRLTTVIEKDNSTGLRASYLRVGRDKSTHVQSNSHIRVPINISTGELSKLGYLPNWQSISEHPDTRYIFKKKLIPNYKECVKLVLKLHENMPMVAAIGWDLSIDKNNKPIIMEWNGYSNDIKFSEATQGPCFKNLNW